MKSFDLEKLLNRIDLVHLVEKTGSTLTGPNSRGEYRGNCILHGGSNPTAFLIYRDNSNRQRWKCWACDQGGDAISFVMATDNLDFMDAIKHLIEEGHLQENTPETHHWLRNFYTFYKGINPDAVTVGEAWSSTLEVVKYIGDQVDLAFEFQTAEAMLKSAEYQNRDHVLRAHRQIAEHYPPNQFATFLTNHDQDRAMSQLRTNVDWAKLAASLLLTGPGVPFLYYGRQAIPAGGGALRDIAPTMLYLLGITPPKEMTGQSLLELTGKSSEAA